MRSKKCSWRGSRRRRSLLVWGSLDPKTVRRYIRAAAQHGITASAGPDSLTDERFGVVLAELMVMRGRPRGESWDRCVAQREFIEKKLDARVRLSKVRKLLLRRGVEVPYSTLHRFATQELGFGRKAPTVPVADGLPGQEVQLDTGWLTTVVADEHGRRRRAQSKRAKRLGSSMAVCSAC